MRGETRGADWSPLEETLLLIARDYGTALLRDGMKTVAFFSDLAPTLKNEKVLLQHLIRCNGNTMLIAALPKPPQEQQRCMRQLVIKMVDELFITEVAAERVCTSFWNVLVEASKPPVKPLSPAELLESACKLQNEDPAKAIAQMTEAANTGYVLAQVTLARWYRDGIVVPKDPRKAFDWYNQAAIFGEDPEAQCNLGWCYATGFGCPANAKLAVTYFKWAADAGVPAAHYNLAKSLENGSGVKQNPALAAKHYEQAARAGHVRAQFRLAQCYENGMGYGKDIDLAIYWYRTAAKNGSADAQFSMGSCYENGNGLDRDPDLAFYWYRQAFANGHREAGARLEKLK